MMSKKGRKPLTCSKKYDLPLYCAAWATHCVDHNKGGEREEKASSKNYEVTDTGHVIFGGGGGIGNTGVRNSLVLAHYDRATDTLSEAIHALSTDDDPPYRMAVHPTGHGIVCSFTRSCSLFELVKKGDSELEGMKLEAASNTLTQLQEVGQQRCLAFSADGTRFAAGGDDGHLRVFEWPSMKLVLDQPEAHKSIKDLDFSLDSAFLASTGGVGPCRIWDLSTATPVASLSLDQGGDLGYCRFSRDGTKPLLFLTVKEGEKGCIAFWDTNTWTKAGYRKFQECPISAFAMSSDGKYLAIGSSEGDISIIDVRNMGLYQRVKRAHMIFVTSMEFSRDGRALLSVSGDSSARVTAIEERRQEASRIRILIFLLLVIILTLYVAKSLLWDRPQYTLFSPELLLNSTD